MSSSRLTRSSPSSSSSTSLGKRSRGRDSPPSPSSSPTRTSTRSSSNKVLQQQEEDAENSRKKSSSIRQKKKPKVVASNLKVRKGKENIPPGEEEEEESEDDNNKMNEMMMDLDKVMESNLSECDEFFDAAATLPTPTTTPTKSKSKSKSTTTERSIPNIFTHAHSLLSTTASTTSTLFLGRESQQLALNQFLFNRFPEVYPPSSSSSSTDNDETLHSPSLYISGPPGLGKTALLNLVLNQFQTQMKEMNLETKVTVTVCMENCSSLGSISSPKTVWERLGKGLGFKLTSNLCSREGFEKGLKIQGGKFLLILDEIDYLTSTTSSSSSKDLLNSLFSIAHSPFSPLTLIGIANALDLTSRSLHLPTFSSSTSSCATTLKGKGKGKERIVGPQLLPFPPYDFKSIESIIKQRLGRLALSYPHSSNCSEEETVGEGKGLPLISPVALMFCAKKVASGTGDIRTALQVVRNAIGIVEVEERSRLQLLPQLPSSVNQEEVENLLITPTKNKNKKGGSRLNDNNNNKLDPLSILTPSSTRKVSMSEMVLSLRSAGLTTPNPLASRLADLPFNTRNVLVGIVVGLSRELNPTPTSNSTPFNISPKSKTTNFKPTTVSIELNKAYEVYSSVLKKEGTVHSPLSKTEFTSVLDLLESVALITLSTCANSSSPTSSKSKSSSNFSSIKRKQTSTTSSNPILSLSPSLLLPDLISALKEIPATNCEIEEELGFARELKGLMQKGKEGVMQETLRISRVILRIEEERVKAVQVRAGVGGGGGVKKNGEDEMAPREGFSGGGLEGEEGKWLGEKRRKLE